MEENSLKDDNNAEMLEKAIPIEEKMSPVEEYNLAFAKSQKIRRLVFILFFVFELGVAGLFGYEICKNNFHNRVVREFENRKTGHIEIPMGIYTGETDFGYFSGKGSFAFNTESTYNGDWLNNSLDGIGILNIPIEGTYEGDFSNSQKNGYGVFTWNDGALYEGEWKKDQMCGQGHYQSVDGVIYDGTFQDNAFWTGKCSFSNITGEYNFLYKNGVIDDATIAFADGSTYNGKCDTEWITGIGTMTFSNGDQYSGSFNNGVRTENGIYTWISGDIYDGGWSEDQMEGTGTYTFANGSYASGSFKDNKFTDGSYCMENDFGKYIFTIVDEEATAVDMTLTNGTTYSGDIKEGELTGQAQIVYSNGDTYSGKVVKGQKSGQGTYNWTGGASYDGSWSGDQMNGTGTYFYSSEETGYKLAGKFESGKPSGQCEYYVSSTEYYKTDWSYGRCVKIYE